jgi:hypothetical protein
MPSILKSLVTISVWILFISGCVALVLGMVFLIRRSEAFHLWSLGAVSLMLSVIAAWFRKHLD